MGGNRIGDRINTRGKKQVNHTKEDWCQAKQTSETDRQKTPRATYEPLKSDKETESMPAEKSKEDEVTTEKVQVNMASAETPKSIREDQVNNAVAFLTHPKVSLEDSEFWSTCSYCTIFVSFQVRDSTEESKKTFLESKGLTEEEIEEAFQRVGINQPTQVSQAPSKPWEKGGNVVTTVVQEKQPIRWSQVSTAASLK